MCMMKFHCLVSMKDYGRTYECEGIEREIQPPSTLSDIGKLDQFYNPLYA